MTSKQVSHHKISGFNTPSEVQAQRMNRNEGNRLRGRIKVFDRMIHRSENLKNNEIRLVRQTLNGMASSSGVLLQSDIAHEEPTAFYMYGERLESRKYGRRLTLMRYLQEQQRREALRRMERHYHDGERNDCSLGGEVDGDFSPGYFFENVVARVENETSLHLEDKSRVKMVVDDNLGGDIKMMSTAPSSGRRESSRDRSLGMPGGSTPSDEAIIETVTESNKELGSGILELGQLPRCKGVSVSWSDKTGTSFHRTSPVWHNTSGNKFESDKESERFGLRYSRFSTGDSQETSLRHRSRGTTPSEAGSSFQEDCKRLSIESFKSSSKSNELGAKQKVMGRGKSLQKNNSALSLLGQSNFHERLVDAPVLPVDAYISRSHPEEEFAMRHHRSKFLFSRPSVYAPTISSRQKALSSFVMDKKC